MIENLALLVKEDLENDSKTIIICLKIVDPMSLSKHYRHKLERAQVRGPHFLSQ